nr:serine/threonine kinase [Caenorhabditis elegans]
MSAASTTSTPAAAAVAPQQPESLYRVVQTLGEGAFGEVLLIVNTKNPEVAAAMKKINIANKSKDFIDNIRKEYLLQKRVSAVGHDNVIRMIGMRNDPQFYYLFLEYADGGELFDKIEPDCGMSPVFAQFYFKQLICGLKFIHDNDVVHRDIKPENLLLTGTHVLKISDFGMATLYRNKGEERLLDLSCGTIPYAAPELCAGKKYRGPPVDVWSSGIVLIAMLTGELPWDRASDASQSYMGWISNTSLDERPWKKIDVRALCMLRKIVTDKTDKRATIEQIQADPWYQHNFGQVETPNGRPLKRARNNDENITCTQQAECSAKRRHLETPNEKSTLAERQNASFSQPTKTEDLLLTQHIDMSQTNSNLLQRMVCRMTRFCVVTDIRSTYQKVARASEHAGFGLRETDDYRLLVTWREVSMMVSLYTMGDIPDKPRVMVDFRSLAVTESSLRRCSWTLETVCMSGYVPTETTGSPILDMCQEIRR